VLKLPGSLVAAVALWALLSPALAEEKEPTCTCFRAHICSEQLRGACKFRRNHKPSCPLSGAKDRPWRERRLSSMKRQVEVERRLFGPRTKFVIVETPHFYVVTDIPFMKLSPTGRTARMHEIAHVYAERAEAAYRDFVEGFGDPVHLPQPSGIYLLNKEATKEVFAKKYFGLARVEIRYGGGSKDISGAHAYNGCAISIQKHLRDFGLHARMRHLVGHNLVSCWDFVSGKDMYLPRWVYAGAAHWLSRRPVDPVGERAIFCAGEGSTVKDSGRGWWKKAAGLAAKRRLPGLQRLFDVSAIGGLDLDAHIRTWSIFELGLAEDRERFLAFLRRIKDGVEERVALRETMGLTPEQFDRRWKDRLLGKRASLAPTPAEIDAANPEDPGARIRASIRSETDPDALASRLRGIQTVKDPLTAQTVVPLLRSESELVRECAVALLSRKPSTEVRTWLRTEGLQKTNGLGRAGVVRVLGLIGDEAAREAVAALAGDPHWLVRANVARAHVQMAGRRDRAPLATLLRDRAPKVRIAAMDALMRMGPLGAPLWREVTDHLTSRSWQVRSVAAQCLGALGRIDACDALITRMENEGGRVRKDIHDALKRITRDDLGENPKHWRDWWAREKARRAGKPPPPPLPPATEEGARYGEVPTYYGLRVYSARIAYVLDTSASMAFTIRLDPEWLKKHERDYPLEASKYTLARHEVLASLRSLDPRALINVYFFRSNATRWHRKLVAATLKIRTSAVSRISGEEPPPGGGGKGYGTNYVDVLRLLLETKKDGPRKAKFEPTADTVYFLTDGKPTEGDIQRTEELRSWFAERNRFARLRMNIIVFGKTNVSDAFLRGLAEDNGGVVIRVPQIE